MTSVAWATAAAPGVPHETGGDDHIAGQERGEGGIYAICSGTEKIMSRAVASCTVSPFSRVETRMSR